VTAAPIGSPEPTYAIITVIHDTQHGLLTASCNQSNCDWNSFSGNISETGSIRGQYDGATEGQRAQVTSNCSFAIFDWNLNPSVQWNRVNKDINKVHVVYMTHLDVGYTKTTSVDVQDLYFQSYYPAAFSTAAQLRTRGGKETFKWTTHPWLLTQFLNNATGDIDAAQLAAMEAAIARGDITWHAGPFNMQAEVADASLYDAGLNIAALLDQRYNKTKKTVLSQKDVPGLICFIQSILYTNFTCI